MKNNNNNNNNNNNKINKHEFYVTKFMPDTECCAIDIPINKQLLDEVEHDIMNYQNRGLCYLPKPKAEADNTDTRV